MKYLMLPLLVVILFLCLSNCGDIQLTMPKTEPDNQTTQQPQTNTTTSTETTSSDEPKNNPDYVTISDGRVRGQVFYTTEQLRANEQPYSLVMFKVYIVNKEIAEYTFTDSSGKFEFYSIPSGEYLLYAINNSAGNDVWICDYILKINSDNGVNVGVLNPKKYHNEVTTENTQKEKSEPKITETTNKSMDNSYYINEILKELYNGLTKVKEINTESEIIEDNNNNNNNNNIAEDLI